MSLPETRPSLLLRVRDATDAESWGEFTALYRPVILRLARRKGLQEADAEDLAQQVLLAVSKAIGRWEPDAARGRFRTWLNTVANNAVLNALTRGVRHQGAVHDDIDELLRQRPERSGPDSDLLRIEIRREVFSRAAQQIRHEFSDDTWNSFWKRIDRHGPLSVAEILRIAMQTARGLAAAHDQGLVHRDIKPGNILLPENVERVLITDFGLARAADDASLTRSGVIAGTPQYMSPEQARGEGVDHRSDLFSLGSMMYTMAAGHPPFRAETPYGILRRITDHPHRPVPELRSDMPPWLCSIIDRLLSKNAAERFASAEEVASLLEDCLAHVQQPSQVPVPEILQPLNPAETALRTVTLFLTAVIAIAVAVLMLRPAASSVHTTDSVTTSSLKAEPASAEPTPPQETPDEISDLHWHNTRQLDELESTLKDLQNEFTAD